MALNIERFDPNIKNPGIKQGTGAYARGDVAQVGDFSAANEQIQKSIKEAGEAIAAMPPGLLQKIKGGIDEISASIEGAGQELTNSINNQIDEILPSVATETREVFDMDLNQGAGGFEERDNQVIETRKTKARKGFFGIGKRDAIKDPSKLTFKDLTRKQKQQALERVGYVKTIRDGIAGPMADFVKNGGDINYTTIANNQEALNFMDHIATKNGKFDIVFEDDKGNKAKGGFIKWNDGTKDHYLHNMQLQSAKDIFKTGAKENRTAIIASMDADVKEMVTEAKSRDLNEEAFNYDEAIVKARKGLLETDEANPAFIFNNMAGNQSTRYDPENPEHVAAVEKYVDDTLRNKLGDERGQRRTDPQPPAGDPRFGGSQPTAVDYNNFNAVMRLRGVTFREEGFKPGDDFNAVVKPLIPKKGSDMFGTYNTIYNEGAGMLAKRDLTQEKLDKIIQHGIVNNGDFSKFEDNDNSYAQKVYEKFNENNSSRPVYDTQIEGDMSEANKKKATLAQVEQILDLPNIKQEINGKPIIREGNRKPKIKKDKNGNRVLVLSYVSSSPTQTVDGEKKVGKVYSEFTYNIDTDEGVQQLFRELSGATESNTSAYNNTFQKLLYDFNNPKK